jgi:enolase
MRIKSVKAKEILDSRGNPTIEVELTTKDGLFKAMVPSGASTGNYEALELRDGGKRFLGKGVLKAVKNVNSKIGKAIIGMDCTKQKEIDDKMIKLDGSKNKSKLGANAILGVSMAVCRAGASAKKIPLYKYIGKLCGNSKMILPIPSFNVINGGRHAGNKLSFQEFMILPVKAKNFKEAMQIGDEIYLILKEIIKKKYGSEDINVGDEGGFAPDISDNKEALELLMSGIKKSGYSKKVRIGIDVAASEFFKSGKYNLNFKERKSLLKSGEDMIEYYKKLVKKYNIISIEDGFDQDDFENWVKLNSLIGKKVQIVGDDLLVTNPHRIRRAIAENACNALLLKINQIGTISESIQAFKIAKDAGWKIMVSHRSGETEDSFIADLAVGLGCGQIKSGAPCRSERLAKYNRLLEIEDELGENRSYGGF